MRFVGRTALRCLATLEPLQHGRKVCLPCVAANTQCQLEVSLTRTRTGTRCSQTNETAWHMSHVVFNRESVGVEWCHLPLTLSVTWTSHVITKRRREGVPVWLRGDSLDRSEMRSAIIFCTFAHAVASDGGSHHDGHSDTTHSGSHSTGTLLDNFDSMPDAPYCIDGVWPLFRTSPLASVASPQGASHLMASHGCTRLSPTRAAPPSHESLSGEKC